MKPGHFACTFVLVLVALGFTAPLCAAPPAPTENARIDAILAQRAEVRQIRDVSLSSDGQHLAWLVSHKDEVTLMLSGANGRNARKAVIPGNCKPEDLSWAPKAATLAVLTRCKVNPTNTKPIHGAIWLLQAEGAAPRKVADVPGYTSDLHWTPEGTRVAFLYVRGATRLAQATASSNPRVGVIGENDVRPEQVATLTLSSGKLAVLTPASLYVYEFDFSPDGERITYTAAPPPGDNNWWIAKLYSQEARAAATPRVLVDPATASGPLHGLQMQQPTWSPDGHDVYFVGGLMSDRGADAGDLYRVAAGGGAPVDLTERIHVTLRQFHFLAPGRLLVTQESLGHVQLAEYGVSAATAHEDRVLFTAPGALFGVSLSSQNPRRIAFAASSFEHAPEVYSGALGDSLPPAVTALNAGLKVTWGKARSVEWQDGAFHVQGWLLYPAHFDPHKSYPLIVSVHGGPTFANLSSWGGNATAFSSFGYFVLLPNPRGSTGEGEAFVEAIRNQMGYGDLNDILAGVDAVEKLVPIDNNRVGMTGWSYGGFMSMFAPTQTSRFHAVVAGAGLSDWQSYYGENQIDQWMIPFFGASLYDDPAAYAKSSAINFIKNDHTPALIVVGERDEECPAPQSFEYWHALKTLGVPATLVVYANQGHRIASRKDQKDILRRTLDWFGKYLAARPAH